MFVTFCVLLNIFRVSAFNSSDTFRSNLTVDDQSRAWLDPVEIRAAPGEEHFFLCATRSSNYIYFEWRKVTQLNGSESLEVLINQSEDLPNVLLKTLEPVLSKNSRTLYQSILRFYRLDVEHAGRYACVIFGGGHITQRLVGDVKVSEAYRHDTHQEEEKKTEKTFLIIMISIVFTFLIFGIFVVIYLNTKYSK